MAIVKLSDFIRCSLRKTPEHEKENVSKEIEVFFAETGNLNTWFSLLRNCITTDEQARANRYYSDSDRITYITCHAVLRAILAEKLNENPLELSFIKGFYDKPGLYRNTAFFNIAHTREAFAIAFARDINVGVDLEKVKQNTNYQSIMYKYFSKEEIKYIQVGEPKEAINRFFLLWTRKEALLKALGIGIKIDLDLLTVSERQNDFKTELFQNLADGFAFTEYFIYSIRYRDYFLSIALPQKCSITLYELNNDNFRAFFSNFPYSKIR